MSAGHVLVLANSSGGLWDFRGELLTRLIGEGFTVTVSLPDELKRREIEKAGCRFVLTPIDRRGMNPLHDLRLIRAWRGLLKEEKPDAVLTYTIKPGIYGGFLCRVSRIPYITTITGLGSTFQNKGAVRTLVTALYRIGLKKSRCVFFQNAGNRAVFEEAGILGKNRHTRLVSGSGVSLTHHTPAPYPGHKDDVVRFLYVGRLMREKGVAEYLKAAEALHARYDDRVSVAAIGYCDEDWQSELDTAVEKGIFKLLPYDPEIRTYLAEADAVVMPSYHEGMSNVLMEAAATARPVLATDIHGCKEIVEDGVTGILFAPRDAKALEDAMCRFMELSVEQRREMGLEGRRKVEREFDRERVVDAYMEEIRIITGKD